MKKIFPILGILLVLALVFRPPVAGGKLTSWWGLSISFSVSFPSSGCGRKTNFLVGA